MSDVTQYLRTGFRAPKVLSVARSFGVVIAALDFATVAASAPAMGWAYYAIVIGEPAPLHIYLAAGSLMAMIYTSIMASRHAYDPRRMYGGQLQFADMFSAWTLSLLGLLLAGFVTKSTGIYSRGTTAVYCCVGFAALVTLRLAASKALQWAVRERIVSLARVVLVGTAERVAAFKSRHQLDEAGLLIEGVYILPDSGVAGDAGQAEQEAATIKRAVAGARRGKVDDIFILVPLSEGERITRCSSAFMTVPARVHLEPDPVLDQFSRLEVARNGGISTFSLARGPLQLTEVIAKRILDVVVASIALVLLSPVLVAAAIAVRLDSPGPVLFRQRRHGFNQDTFEILKFRTMTVTEAGDSAKQATRNDARITRVGAFLRRSSIDELPQLLNVLLGTMSIVGPRPHPTALDRAFEPKIALYARRHNVKPGITGWAQVNGFRGETDTDDKMRSRVDYDLYYIEHWSLGFDLYIMACTLLSPKVFANAY